MMDVEFQTSALRGLFDGCDGFDGFDGNIQWRCHERSCKDEKDPKMTAVRVERDGLKLWISLFAVGLKL
jgi:hypothetical protein